MRRVPYASREWKDDAGRGVVLSTFAADQRFAVRIYVRAKEEQAAIGVNVFDAQKAFALEALTREVSAEFGETVELYAV